MNVIECRIKNRKFHKESCLQMVSAEQNERENIRQRQAEGISAAKARSVKFGRSFRFKSELIK